MASYEKTKARLQDALDARKKDRAVVRINEVLGKTQPKKMPHNNLNPMKTYNPTLGEARSFIAPEHSYADRKYIEKTVRDYEKAVDDYNRRSDMVNEAVRTTMKDPGAAAEDYSTRRLAEQTEFGKWQFMQPSWLLNKGEDTGLTREEIKNYDLVGNETYAYNLENSADNVAYGIMYRLSYINNRMAELEELYEKGYSEEDGWVTGSVHDNDEYKTLKAEKKQLHEDLAATYKEYGADHLGDMDGLLSEKKREIRTVRKYKDRYLLEDEAFASANLDEYYNRYKQLGNMLGHESKGLYTYMEEDEKKVYAYHYLKYGYEKAEQYFNSIKDDLELREAQAEAAEINGKWFEEAKADLWGNIGGTLAEYGGVWDAFRGKEKTIDYPQSYYISQYLREDDTGAWKAFTDTVSAIGGMIPSIGASVISDLILPGSGKYVGLTLTGASAMSGAYSEMISLGYSPDSARTYGTLVGTAEVVLERLLGGISVLAKGRTSSLARIFSPALNKAFTKLSVAHPKLWEVVKGVGKVAGSMGSEALEEGLQTALEPVFKAYATGEDFEAAELEEILYSSLLGALSGGVFEVAPYVAKGVGKAIKGNKLYAQAAIATNTEAKKYSPAYIGQKLNTAVVDLVNRVKNKGAAANEKAYFDNVSDKNADTIQDITGVDVHGFKVAIEARQVEHILKRHGENGAADKSMSNIEDIAKMQFAMSEPDSIRRAGKTQAYTYMKNGRNKTADTILYEKSIGDGSYYVVQAVADTKAKTLYVVSAFIGEPGYNNGASQLIDANIPNATSDNGSANTPVDSIPQNGETVKGENGISVPDVDYVAPLMRDPEVAAIIAEMDATETANTGVRLSSQAVMNEAIAHPEQSTQPKVRTKTIFERNGMLPTAAEQAAQAKADAAKTDTARTGYLAGATNAQIYIAEQLSKFTGRQILFISDNYAADGEFDGKNTILVNLKRGNIVSQVIAHELTHAVEGTEEYTRLVDSIKGFLETYSAKGVIADWDTFYHEVYTEYEHKYTEITGEEFNDAKAEREIVARVMETLFGEGDTATERQIDLVEFVKHNRNAATRMWYRLSQIAKRLREDIANFIKKRAFGKGYDTTFREHQLMLREIERIRDRFGRALVQAKGKDGTGERAMKFVGIAEDGKKIYASNFPLGTPKAAKSERILNYIKNVWSKKPISLVISNGETTRTILAKFDPTVDESMNTPTDASKIAGGNRHGTSSEQRVTLDLADDYYEIATDAKYNYSREEIGKENPAHEGVVMWHYFVNDIYFSEYGDSKLTPYTVTINVKEKSDGDFVYSFNAEKEPPTRRTLHADVNTYKGANGELFVDNSISHSKKDDNKQTVNNSVKSEFSFSKGDTVPRNQAEEANRREALSMYKRMRDEQRRQDPNALTAEDIYNQTGWYYDEYGNFVVDHDAPVYAKDMTDNERARSYVEYAHKFAETAEAENSQLHSENIALREDVAKWQARAEAAEKAARIIERDAAARIASDRQLSPDYMPSKKQVKGIITEIGDMLGGGFSTKQINDFTARLLDIYDSIGVNVRYASELTRYSKDISDLISDMQDVRLERADNTYIADRLRSDLKSVPLYLSQKARGDISGGYGSAARKYRGKVNLTTKEKGTPVDVRYMELSTLYPDWFSPEITNESEQLMRMLEVSDQISDKNFTSRDRYADVGADADGVRTSDFGKAMLRILEGYNEVESVPRTLADGLMRQLEYEGREHQRELARATEEVREKLEAEHKAQEEALMREAEAAMEWETRYLRDELSRIESEQRNAEKKAADDAKAAKDAKARRAHERGQHITNAAIKASQDDGSFTAKMTEVYERFTALEDEIARVEAECKRHEHVDTETLRDKSEKQYIKELRVRRDALIEKKSNLEAYINKVNARVKDIRFKTMCDMIANDRYFADWNDKAFPLLYSIETMRRNVQAIAPKKRDSALAKYIIEELLDPITSATYMTTVVRNEVRDRVKALGLSRKVKKGDFLSESQFVQAYGEAVDNIKALESGEGSFIYNKRGEPMREGMTAKEWRGYLNRIVAENPGITKDKARFEHMKEAVNVFKEIYDELFTVVNAARVRNGYAPVPYHRGYFPHYNNATKQDGVFSLMLQGFGFRQQEISEKLPTSINGMTATFRPGIRYMSNAKQRSMAGVVGERQVTGAVEGLDRYIEVATDVAFQTDNIQNLRALANAIRYTTTSDETKARIEKIKNDDSLTTEQKQEDINNLFASKTDKTKYALNNFVVDLEEYTNLLAGKKSRHDREGESLVGRSFYNMMRRLTGRVASNAIVGNIGSALTNFIPLMDGGAVMHYHMLGAMWDMFKSHVTDDGFVSTSQFLTNRRGSQRLVRSGMDVASDVGSSAMNFVDNLTSELLMRARVRQNMSKHRGGMSYNAAMKEADTFIAGMMGDRSKGALPTAFGAMNPIAKAFTMYQVEVKNQFGFMFRDMRMDSGVGEWVLKLMMMAILHRLYNDLYEKLVGRRPALDPLEMINDLAGDISGYKFESIDGLLDGDGDFIAETEKKNPVGAGLDFLGNIGKETPFIGGIMFDGGRIPTSSMLPDMSALRKAFEGMVGGDDGREIGENLYKGISPTIYYGFVPLGGGQLKKGVEGANALLKGGSYTYDKEGNRQLQYPIFTDEGANTVGEIAKTALFGKTSTETGHEWVENGFGYLSANQTAAYEEMVKVGEGQRESWELVQELRATNPETGRTLARLDVLMKSDVIDEAKVIAFTTFVSTADTWPAKIEQFMKAGGDFDDFLRMYRFNSITNGDGRKDKIMAEIDKMNISNEQKDALYLMEYKETTLDDTPWYGGN